MGVYPPASAVISGNHVYTAGQLPFVNAALPATGKVGAEINALAAIATVLGSLDRITRVVKVGGFVSSDPGFYGQAGVVNGASELLGDVGVHARSAVGVAALPMNAPV